MSAGVVTLTGPPGSGKSTAGRAAADALHLAYVSAGELFRAEAARAGVDLAEFSRRAEADPSVDRALDERMLALAEPGRLLEGRVTGALLARRGVPTIRLVVTAREEVRAERLAHRDRLGVPEALKALRAREASETRRYLAYYGIDLAAEPAEFTVDSSEIPAAEVARRLVAFVRSRSTGGAA